MPLDLPSPDRPLRIGTRGSPLALAQAHEVRDRLMAAHGLGEAAFAVEVIRTTGDRVQDRPLATLGGKGLFAREIEEALAAGAIDVAVHSMKDMPTLQPEGLVISALLPREDPRDGFVCGSADSLAALADAHVHDVARLDRPRQMEVRAFARLGAGERAEAQDHGRFAGGELVEAGGARPDRERDQQQQRHAEPPHRAPGAALHLLASHLARSALRALPPASEAS